MKNEINQYINQLYQNPKKRSQLFSEIPETKQIPVFLQLRKPLQYQILRSLPKDQIISLLESLDPDDATDVIQLFDSHTQQRLLKELSEDIQNEIGLLLKFNEKTAGGPMS